MASASFKGDLQGLKQLAQKFQTLTEFAWKQETNRLLSEAALSLVIKGFDDSRAPNGVKWKALKNPRRRGDDNDMPLLDTGHLRDTIYTRYTSATFGLVAPVIYAATHQYGRDNIPARPFLPEAPFPGKYQKAFESTFRERAKEALKGGGRGAR